MTSLSTPSSRSSARRGESQIVSSFRCVSAMMLREMGTRYGRRPGGYVWALLQPLGMIILLSIVFALVARHPVLGTSFMLFKGTGMLILQMFTNVSNTTGQSLSYSKPLLSFPRVSWMDAVLARFFLNSLVSIVVTFIILVAIVIFDSVKLDMSWGPVFQAVILSCLFGLGVGCLNSYFLMRFPVWLNVWGILTAPLFIISGVLFLYEDLPPLGQDILWYNPLMHTTAMMRDGFYANYSPTFTSPAYVLACALIPMVLGLLLLRQYHKDLLQR